MLCDFKAQHHIEAPAEIKRRLKIALLKKARRKQKLFTFYAGAVNPEDVNETKFASHRYPMPPAAADVEKASRSGHVEKLRQRSARPFQAVQIESVVVVNRL
jgi:hypothetical protein